jgi:hypothetical protein
VLRSNELALASSLVNGLNGGDIDAVVSLFDPEAILEADRYAWSRFEIGLWARTQIDATIKVEPEASMPLWIGCRGQPL